MHSSPLYYPYQCLTIAFQELTLADLFHLMYAVVFGPGGLDLMTKKGPNVERRVSFLVLTTARALIVSI